MNPSNWVFNFFQKMELFIHNGKAFTSSKDLMNAFVDTVKKINMENTETQEKWKTKWLVLYYCPDFLADYHLDTPEAFTDFDLDSLDETGYSGDGDRITMRVYVYADSQEEAETKLLETYDDENVELR